MLRDQPLVENETYHIFNRGAHKQTIFPSKIDYERFLLLLYLCNFREPVNIRETLIKHKGSTFGDIFLKENLGERLVDIFAYTLMPNHFHFVLRQRIENGISLFMRKVSTGYTMSFNKKYGHSGVVFQGRFKSRHVGDESYFRYIFAYVHLNPVALVEPKWKESSIRDVSVIKKFVQEYPYSSHFDYQVKMRPQSKILSLKEAPDFLREINDIEIMLKEIDSPPKVEPLGEGRYTTIHE